MEHLILSTSNRVWKSSFAEYLTEVFELNARKLKYVVLYIHT